MPSMTSVKYSNAKFRKIAMICGIAAAAVILVAVGIYFLIHNGVFYKKTDTDGKSYELTAEMQADVSETAFHRGYMFSRTMRLLSEDRQMDPWVLSWYSIPGTTRNVPAMESAYVDSFDQVLLLESYVKDGKRSKAESLIKAIDSSLTDGNGYLLAFRKADDLAGEKDRKKAESCDGNEDPAYLLISEPPVSMKATTRYLRALLDYYDKWGSSKTLDKIKTLAGKIFEYSNQTSYRAADQMAKPTPIPVTEKSLVTPVPDEDPEDNGESKEKLVSLSGTELAAMDLEAMRRASVLLPEYKEKYEETVRIVKEGKISSELPLYAWMHTSGGYMYYTGSQTNVDVVSSLYVMVHLAEIGQLDAEGYAWISQQIYNTGYLYTSYDLMSGEALSDVEASEGYALVLYLSVIKGDERLFSATYKAMMRNYATLSTSDALYTFFRNIPESRISVYARENLLMELILK
ncbi:MAG: hypothetical protein J6Y58_02415 [Clostridiales bacterium]|nr:hypothetical protein [Clostridiales bacterium]